MEHLRHTAREPANLLLRKVEKALLDGNEDAACLFLDWVRSLGPVSPQKWEVCAKLNELMGRLSEALEDYARALEEEPHRGDLFIRRARVLLEMGREVEAKADLKKALMVGASLDDVRNQLGALLRPLMPSQEPDSKVIEDAFYKSRFRRRAVERFLTLFRGRPGAYARQWFDRKEGKSGYFPVLQPLTAEIVEAHLEGKITVGVYLLDAQAMVHFGALDLDLGKDVVAQINQDPAASREVANALRGLMAAIEKASGDLGLPAVFERSGYKGVHVWYFFEGPVPAWAAKAVLSAVVKAVSPPPPHVQIEVFPKQVALSKKGYGNLIKLPLGVHRTTGKRSVFLDSKGIPVSDSLQYLMEIETIPVEKIMALAQELERPGEARVVPFPPADKLVSRPVETIPTMSPPPQTKQDIKEAYAKLLENCCLIRYLVRKAREFKHLSFDERKVVLGVLGHLPGGTRLVHHVISNCSDYDPQITNHFISRMPRAPLGCRSIRRKLFYLDQKKCSCRFEIQGKAYPSPCLHALSNGGHGSLSAHSENFSVPNR